MPRPAGHKLNRVAFQDFLDLRGVSLTEVADRADLPRSTVSALVGGFSKAATPNAHRIALALDCQPATLFPTLTPHFVAVDPPKETKGAAA